MKKFMSVLTIGLICYHNWVYFYPDELSDTKVASQPVYLANGGGVKPSSIFNGGGTKPKTFSNGGGIKPKPKIIYNGGGTKPKTSSFSDGKDVNLYDRLFA